MTDPNRPTGSDASHGFTPQSFNDPQSHPQPSWGQPDALPGWGPADPSAGSHATRDTSHSDGNPGGPYVTPDPCFEAPASVKPGIIALRPLSIGELFEGAFTAFRRNTILMLGFPAIVYAVAAIISGINISSFFTSSRMMAFDAPQTLSWDSFSSMMKPLIDELLSSSFTGIAIFLTSLLLWPVITIAVADAVIGRTPSISETFQRACRRLLPLIGTLILIQLIAFFAVMIALGICIGFFFVFLFFADFSSIDVLNTGVAFAIAFFFAFISLIAASALMSLFVSVRLLYAPVVCIIEEVGPITALRRSWNLTRGRFWATAGRYLLITLVFSTIAGIISGIGTGLVSLATLISWSPVFLALGVAVSIFLSLLATPILYAFVVLMYTDERMRSEGFASALTAAAAAR